MVDVLSLMETPIQKKNLLSIEDEQPSAGEQDFYMSALTTLSRAEAENINTDCLHISY
jgi:hypothetical protein